MSDGQLMEGEVVDASAGSPAFNEHAMSFSGLSYMAYLALKQGWPEATPEDVQNLIGSLSPLEMEQFGATVRKAAGYSNENPQKPTKTTQRKR